MSLEENRASGNAERASTGIEVLASPEPDTELWWCEIAPVAARLDAYEQWLSPAERNRASRFGNPRLRDRYVMGRGTLRSIIAGSFGTTVDAIVQANSLANPDVLAVGQVLRIV